MFKCPKCGKELEDGFTFCPYCGETIKPVGDVPEAANAGSIAQVGEASEELVKTEKKRKSVWLYIAIAALVIGIIIAAILILGKKCEHEYTSVITKEATCSIKGVKTFTCSKCGDSYEEEIPLMEHKYVGVQTTAPTCTKEGTTTFTCSVCGDAYTEPIEKLPHTFGDVVVVREATCSEEGEMTASCLVCGETGITEKIPKIPHTYSSEITKDPTCISTGIKTFTCEVCGDSYTEDIEKVAHNYKSAITKDPTCISTGIRTFTCEVCGDSYTEDIEKVAHNYKSAITKEPSCTVAGERTYTCSACGNSYTESIAPVAHTYTEQITTQPSCTANGIKTFTCSTCGNSYTESIPMIEHQYARSAIKEATCTEPGECKYQCSICGDTITESLAALGHEWLNATCTTPQTCQRCGMTEGNALGHSYPSSIYDSNYNYCTRCHKQKVVIITNVPCPLEIKDSRYNWTARFDSFTARLEGAKLLYSYSFTAITDFVNVYHCLRDANGNIVWEKAFQTGSRTVGETYVANDQFITYIDDLPEGTYTLMLRSK